MALSVQSVQELWFFTGDLVFVLLFPQLVCALFDPKANRIGSITAFVVSFVLRLGGGEPLLGLEPFIPYPELLRGSADATRRICGKTPGPTACAPCSSRSRRWPSPPA